MAAERSELLIESLRSLFSKATRMPDLIELGGDEEKAIAERRGKILELILQTVGRRPVWTAIVYGAFCEQEPGHFSNEQNLRDFIQTVETAESAHVIIAGHAKHKGIGGFLTISSVPYGSPPGGRLGFVTLEQYGDYWRDARVIRNTSDGPGPDYLFGNVHHLMPEFEVVTDAQLFEAFLVGVEDALARGARHMHEMLSHLESYKKGREDLGKELESLGSFVEKLEETIRSYQQKVG